MGSGHADKAAIVSAAGDSVWAKSADFDVRPELAISGAKHGEMGWRQS